MGSETLGPSPSGTNANKDDTNASLHPLQTIPGHPPQSRLEEEIENICSSFNERSEKNIWEQRIVDPAAIDQIIDTTRIRTVAGHLYDQAYSTAYGDSHSNGPVRAMPGLTLDNPEKRKEKEKRIDEFVSFVVDGNRKAFAILLCSGVGYGGLWLFDSQGHGLQRPLAPEEMFPIDKDLPLSREKSIRMFGHQRGPIFYDMQYAFLPVELHRGQAFKRTDPKQRLPIIEREFLGSGASSDVYKITIAAGLWVVDGSRNNHPFDVAMKVYRGALIEQTQRKREEEFHRRAREASEQNSYILPYWGSIDEGDELSLLFPCAHMTLEDFLRRQNNANLTLQDIMRSLANIGDAVYFLNRGGLRKDGQKYPISHGDLRPDNVLIWTPFSLMIADFGTSKLLELPKTDSPVYTTPPKADAGAYSAPPTVKYIARDVWGFIAMSVVTIVHHVGGPVLVQDFSDHRSQGRKVPDQFWVPDDLGSFKVNRLVHEWLKNTLKPKIQELFDDDQSAVLCALLDELTTKCLQDLLVCKDPAQEVSPSAEDVATKLRDAAPGDRRHLVTNSELPAKLLFLDPNKPFIPIPEDSSTAVGKASSRGSRTATTAITPLDSSHVAGTRTRASSITSAHTAGGAARSPETITPLKNRSSAWSDTPDKKPTAPPPKFNDYMVQGVQGGISRNGNEATQGPQQDFRCRTGGVGGDGIPNTIDSEDEDEFAGHELEEEHIHYDNGVLDVDVDADSDPNDNLDTPQDEHQDQSVTKLAAADESSELRYAPGAASSSGLPVSISYPDRELPHRHSRIIRRVVDPIKRVLGFKGSMSKHRAKKREP